MFKGEEGKFAQGKCCKEDVGLRKGRGGGGWVEGGLWTVRGRSLKES